MLNSTRPVPTDAANAAHITVCIVEDEAALLDEMCFQLRHRGFSVHGFQSAPELYRFLATQPCTVVVLDIGLPGEDGLAICGYLRRYRQSMGVIFVTARGLRHDRLAGLAAGADAYLVKPVDMDELQLLIARLAARQDAAGPPQALAPPPASQAAWHLDEESLQLVGPQGTAARLSMAEFQVVRCLLRKGGQACTHAEIATAMGLLPEEWDHHRVEVVLSRLRNKVERYTGVVLPVRSVRGVGYVMARDERLTPRGPRLAATGP